MDHAVDADTLAVAHRLADLARPIARRYFRRLESVEDKTDASPVTIADREIERTLRDALETLRPADGIVGEEEADVRADAERVWVIDPIDGTRAFITGRPTFVTLIALLDRGRPILGVIDQPIVEDRWLGARGHATRFGDAEARSRPVARLDQAQLLTTAPEAFDATGLCAFDAVKGAAKRVYYGGDAFNYGLLASGHVDLVIEQGLKLHDFAALGPVITGAGGVVTDWAGAALDARSDGTVLAAATPALHAEALARVEAALAGRG